MDNATKWARTGFRFQLPMMAIFMLQFILFSDDQPSRWAILQIVDITGCLIFMWCLWRLYAQNARTTELITTGFFKYTRHPMYLGLLMMNIGYWLRVEVWTSFGFLLLEAMFIGCMVIAAHYQELETLARFGKDAEDYYARTPRFPRYSAVKEGVTSAANRVTEEARKVHTERTTNNPRYDNFKARVKTMTERLKQFREGISAFFNKQFSKRKG